MSNDPRSNPNEWRTIWTDRQTHPFAHAIHNYEWILVTGVGGHVPWSDEISEDTREQTRQALANLRELLALAGSSLDEVVQIRPYVTDRSYAEPMDEVLRDEISEPRPASGALVICQLIDPRMHVELEAMAHRGARRVADSR